MRNKNNNRSASHERFRSMVAADCRLCRELGEVDEKVSDAQVATVYHRFRRVWHTGLRGSSGLQDTAVHGFVDKP